MRQEHAESAKWFRLAAEQEDANAQYNLGALYDIGQGVPRDYAQAYMCYNLAASKGDETATGNRDIVAAKMTPAQIAEAQRRARKWKPKKSP